MKDNYDLSSRDFTADEKAFLIANGDFIIKFLEINMTYMINSKVETREDIKMCRSMKDQGIEFIQLFKDEHEQEIALRKEKKRLES